MRRHLLPLIVAMPLAAQTAPPTVRVGAFVDGYYAWDSGRPVSRDRAFTTQAVRHDEFNVNLAHVEASFTGERVRGRLALQAGTAVQANYAGEPALGNHSGPSLSRHLLEAVVGLRVVPAFWVDGGIYFSPIGNESWLSRDNPTYTRSFTAEYTPYYVSGVRGTWTPAAGITAQLHLVNGWQNISENNDAKALAARIDWTASPGLTLSWAAFRGNERPDGEPGRRRDFQQAMAAMAKIRLAPGAALWLTADKGWEARGGGARRAAWWSATAIGDVALSPVLSAAGRLERFVDRDGVLIPVAASGGFDVTSASFGLNLRLPEGAAWRSEVRGFRSGAAVWPEGRGTGRVALLLVTSLSLTMP